MICTTDLMAPFLTAQSLCSMASSIGVRNVCAILLLTLWRYRGSEDNGDRVIISLNYKGHPLNQRHT